MPHQFLASGRVSGSGLSNEVLCEVDSGHHLLDGLDESLMEWASERAPCDNISRILAIISLRGDNFLLA